MSDFRCWRDWLFFGEGPHGLNGSAQNKKLDANGDGFVDERESTVFPRGDFNGDGYLHRKDEVATQAPTRPRLGKDRLLSAQDAAKLLGVKPRWVYDHADELGAQRLSARCLRFSEKALRRRMERGRS